jgi:hypothetical protein
MSGTALARAERTLPPIGAESLVCRTGASAAPNRHYVNLLMQRHARDRGVANDEDKAMLVGNEHTWRGVLLS